MATILIVEDEKILSDLMVAELGKTGHTLLRAANGQEAWDQLELNQVDIILSDLRMPVMNGYELLEKMRADARFKTLPCLVISNSGQIDDLNRAFTVGATDVLIKTNFNPDQLVGKIDQLLQTSATASEKAA